jgi:ubiquitin carboxyl-terminal hydrolase MINDY-3/4
VFLKNKNLKMSKKTSSSSASNNNNAAIPDDHPVLQLDRDTQAKLLSEALLREFMHKRKFLQTLKQFDIENPRNEMTITSRALMQELMTMQKVMPQMKSQHGIESIVEAVCEHRIEKKHHLQEMKEMEKEIEALTSRILPQLKKELEEQKKANELKEKELERATAKAASASVQQNTTSSSSSSNKSKLDSMKKEGLSAEQQARNLSMETARLRVEIAERERKNSLG